MPYPSPKYRFVIYDRNKAKEVCELADARNRSFSTCLNREGEARFTINLTNSKATSDILALRQNELRVYRDDTLVWGGELTLYEGGLDAEAEDVTVYAKSYLDLLRTRYTGASREFNNIDAGIIAWTLIDESQQLTDGDFGLASGEIQTSVNRLRLYEYKNLYEAIVQLSDVYNGFEFEITPNKVFNVYYPQKGSDKTDDFQLVWGRNIKRLDFSYDFSEPCNQAVVLGAGEGANMIFATRTDITARSRDKLRQQKVLAKDIVEFTTLNDKGDKVLSENKNPIETLTIVQAAGTASFTDVSVGDTIHIEVSRGLLSIADDYRIQEIHVRISDGGEEEVTYIVSKITKVEETVFDSLRKLKEQIEIWGSTAQTIWGTNVLTVAPTVGTVVGTAKLVFDGENKRILVNDGVTDRIVIGNV